MIIDDNIQAYLTEVTSPQFDLLQALEKETYQKMVLPQMISGHYQGRVFILIYKKSKWYLQKILEWYTLKY